MKDVNIVVPTNLPIDVGPTQQAAAPVGGDGGTDQGPHKVTAAQVGSNCPSTLQDLGKRIAAHLDKAHKCEEKAEQHYATVGQLLTQAQDVCDDGGFTAFRERFCPDLAKSRAYELLAIATNKKTLEEIRADTRQRVAKHRAKKKALRYVTEAANANSTDLQQVNRIGVTSQSDASAAGIDNSAEIISSPRGEVPKGDLEAAEFVERLNPARGASPELDQGFAELEAEWINAVQFRRAIANAPLDLREIFHAEVVRAYRE